MDKGILRLADEIIRIVLEYITTETEKLVNLEQRGYLSQESFKSFSPPEPDQVHTIAAFRLTCRRFAELGIIHQLVPFDYNGISLDVLYTPLIQHPNLDYFKQKVIEQRELVGAREDARVLSLSLPAFVNLQHVQLLRVVDNKDEELVFDLRERYGLQVQPVWSSACERSIQAIGAALLHSGHSACSRFSSPVFSPQMQMRLGTTEHPLPTQPCALITSLELHFDDSHDLDDRIRQLSSFSRDFFAAASNLEALHIGFPPYRHVTVPLEDFFHETKWNKLRSFGLQAWVAEANEIIAIAQRHSKTLQGLRLRDVLLKEGGGRWGEVILALHEMMNKLDWVSLRRIDYAKFYYENRNIGAEIPDEFTIGSDSSEEDSDWYMAEDDDDGSNDSVVDSDIASDAGTEEDTDEPEQGGHLHFPPHPDTPVSVPCCCNGNIESIETLGDDGIHVTNGQRKWWEKFCVNKLCSEHQGHR